MGSRWGDHHPGLFRGRSGSSAPGTGQSRHLEWLPAPRRRHREAGTQAPRSPTSAAGTVSPSSLMAEAFPESTLRGFDFHPPSIDAAAAGGGRSRRRRAGRRSRSPKRRSIRAAYDLVCFFDCLHDMGDPVGIARYAASRSRPAEPCCWSSRSRTTAGRRTSPHPTAELFYGASTMVCTPNSLSQEVGSRARRTGGRSRAPGRSSTTPATATSGGRRRRRSTSCTRREPDADPGGSPPAAEVDLVRLVDEVGALLAVPDEQPEQAHAERPHVLEGDALVG